AAELLMSRLHESTIPQELRTALAIVALQLVDQPDSESRAWTELIAGARGKRLLKPEWSNPLIDAAGRMEPPIASQVLTAELSHEPDPNLMSALVAVADTLKPEEAAMVLTSTLERASYAGVYWRLAKDLASVAKRMEPAEAAKVCGRAAKILLD